MAKILVVGSSNTDMVIQANHIPVPGETILGGKFIMNQGGKGANQAVASARLGGEVTFVTKIGHDSFGEQAIKTLRTEGINTEYISISNHMPSGVAMIYVGQNAENSIIVAPGSNMDLKKVDIKRALLNLEQESIILVQLEIPLNVVEYTIDMARLKGIKVILNPAPAHKLPDSILKSLFAITPNETEAELLTGVKVTDEASAQKAAKILWEYGVQNVIITMGKKGAYLYVGTSGKIIPSQRVEAIDTTAAGDTFNGALAVAIQQGRNIEEAIYFANKAAAIAVTRMGAQTGMPYLADLEVFHTNQSN